MDKKTFSNAWKNFCYTDTTNSLIFSNAKESKLICKIYYYSITIKQVSVAYLRKISLAKTRPPGFDKIFITPRDLFFVNVVHVK